MATTRRKTHMLRLPPSRMARDAANDKARQGIVKEMFRRCKDISEERANSRWYCANEALKRSEEMGLERAQIQELLPLAHRLFFFGRRGILAVPISARARERAKECRST